MWGGSECGVGVSVGGSECGVGGKCGVAVSVGWVVSQGFI